MEISFTKMYLEGMMLFEQIFMSLNQKNTDILIKYVTILKIALLTQKLIVVSSQKMCHDLRYIVI